MAGPGLNIFMLTVGTRGDVQPFVALGKGLQAAGNRVTVCTSQRFEAFVRGHGLDYGHMSNALLDLLETPEGRTAIETTTGLLGALRTTLRLSRQARTINRRLLHDAWAAARTAAPDMILFHPKGLAGPHMAEKFSVPAMLVLPAPMLVPTGAFPLLGLPHLDHGPRFNRATYRLVTWSYRLYGRMLNRFRREELGLGPLPRSANVLSRADGRPVPVLHGYSPQVVPRPADWPPDAHVTGYWFLASADPWRPPAKLAAFLAAGTPPVYVGFGSMAGRRPRRLARIVVEALRKTGHRGILATGWGGLESMHRPRTILKIRQAPHDWLFPRTAGVVHHGGAGTTAAGLRAGRPTLICPFIADQPFWGHRIHSLGLGPEPIPQRKLSAQALARSLRTLTGSDVIRDKAAAMGRRIRKENGIARAVEIIEKIGRHAAAD